MLKQVQHDSFLVYFIIVSKIPYLLKIIKEEAKIELCRKRKAHELHPAQESEIQAQKAAAARLAAPQKSLRFIFRLIKLSFSAALSLLSA